MRLGSFELVEELGVGSFGTVWSATNGESAKAAYAVKILADWALDREAEERFRDELTVLSSLAHPNIVRIAESGVVPPMRSAPGTGVVPGAPWYAMDRARGSLSQNAPSHSELPDVVEGLLAALAVIHAEGLVHGDLSPGNILLLEDGRYCISDFGSVYFCDHKRGGGFATRRYAAPELLDGQPQPQSDLFSLGKLVLDLLHAAPEDSPLRQWALTLCQRDIDSRPATAAEAIRSLKRLDEPDSGRHELHWSLVWRRDANEASPLWHKDQAPSPGLVLTDVDARWLKVTRSACAAGETILVAPSPRGALDALRAATLKVCAARGRRSRTLRIALAPPATTWFEADTTRLSASALCGVLAEGDRPIVLAPAEYEYLGAQIDGTLPFWRIAASAPAKLSRDFDPRALAMVYVLELFDADRIRSLSRAMDVPFSHGWLRDLEKLGLIAKSSGRYSAAVSERGLDEQAVDSAWISLEQLEAERPSAQGLRRLAEGGRTTSRWNAAATIASQYDPHSARVLAESVLRGAAREWLAARIELASLARESSNAVHRFATRMSADAHDWAQLLAYEAQMFRGDAGGALRSASAAWESATDPFLRAAATLARGRALHANGQIGAAADECTRAAARFARLNDEVHVALCDELQANLMIAIGSVERGRELQAEAASCLARHGAGYAALRGIAASQGEDFVPPKVISTFARPKVFSASTSEA